MWTASPLSGEATHLLWEDKMKAARLLYGSSENADALYATGLFVPDRFIFFEHKGRRFLLMSDLEFERAKRQCRGCTVLPLRRYKKMAERAGKRAGFVNIVDMLLRERGISDIEVPGDFPAWLYRKLLNRGYKVRCPRDAFFPEREIKKQAEQCAIEATQRINETALELALEMLGEAIVRNGKLYLKGKPLTSEQLKRSLNHVYLDHDCACPDGMIISCGGQTALPHHCGSGVLRANVPIIIDLFPRSMKTGYWADITRTVVKGKAPNRLKAMYNAVLAAQERALGMVREGVLANTVHSEALRVLESHGFKTGAVRGTPQGLIHSTGHGLGLEIHERPRLGSENREPLRAGNVVTVEPGLYYTRLGGVRIEDLVIVTKRGCRNLTKAGKFLELD